VDLESFGGRLYRLRREWGYTQTELADKLGTTRGCIANWEKGRRRPRGKLERIAFLLGVSTDYLNGKIGLEEEISRWDQKEQKHENYLDLSLLEPRQKQSVVDYYRYLIANQEQDAVHSQMKEKLGKKQAAYAAEMEG
jgi:transcriptional regulator with XRE-family HTH domain